VLTYTRQKNDSAKSTPLLQGARIWSNLSIRLVTSSMTDYAKQAIAKAGKHHCYVNIYVTGIREFGTGLDFDHVIGARF